MMNSTMSRRLPKRTMIGDEDLSNYVDNYDPSAITPDDLLSLIREAKARFSPDQVNELLSGIEAMMDELGSPGSNSPMSDPASPPRMAPRGGNPSVAQDARSRARNRTNMKGFFTRFPDARRTNLTGL